MNKYKTLKLYSALIPISIFYLFGYYILTSYQSLDALKLLNHGIIDKFLILVYWVQVGMLLTLSLMMTIIVSMGYMALFGYLDNMQQKAENQD